MESLLRSILDVAREAYNSSNVPYYAMGLIYLATLGRFTTKLQYCYKKMLVFHCQYKLSESSGHFSLKTSSFNVEVTCLENSEILQPSRVKTSTVTSSFYFIFLMY